MARIPRAVPLVAALLSGVATSGLLYLHLSAKPAMAPVERLPMVVSARSINDTAAIRASDCQVVLVAERPAGAFGSLADLEGRLPLVTIPPGQPILSSHLAARDAQAGLWGRVPPGKRAITVAINEVAGVGGFIRAGLNVDMIGVARVENDWQSRTVAQNVPVLAVAQDDARSDGASKAKVSTSATLLVSPEQAEAISLAGERGSVRLILRGPNDHTIRKLSAPQAAQLARKREAAPPVIHAARPAAPVRQRPEAAAVRPRPDAPPPSKPVAQAPHAGGVEIIRGFDSEVIRP